MPIVKTYNRSFFKAWSHDMAYILGFLYADGNIVKTKRDTHFVALYTADKYLLEDIRTTIASDHVISTRASETGKVYRIQIGSREWFDDLDKLGLTPKKSKRMCLPAVPAKYVGSFVRGYFDGDGNVWAGHINRTRQTPTFVLYVAFTSGSIAFLESLLELLRKHGIQGGSFYVVKSGTYGRLSFSTWDALKLYQIMYNMPHRLFLDRKKKVFEQFVKRSKKVRA